MTNPMLNDDDETDLPSPWADTEEFGPRAPLGSGFWSGTGDPLESGPLRGWWIRKLYIAALKHSPHGGPLLWERMVYWLVEQGSSSYLRFCDDATFRPGSAPGHWVVLEKDLAVDLQKAFGWATEALGATQSLDALLADPTAFMRVAPREPCGAELLRTAGDSVAVPRFWKGRRCRDRWPRPCTTCQREFRPERRGIVRCEECRAIRHPSSGKRERVDGVL